VDVDTTGPLFEGAQRVSATHSIEIAIKDVGSGAGVELHGSNGFEVLTAANTWASVPIKSHTQNSVLVGDVAGGPTA
jgi:hypothetical protein